MYPMIVEAGHRFIKHHSHAHQPARLAWMFVKGNQKRQRPHESLVEPNVKVALVTGFPGESEPKVLNITEAAVNHFGAATAGARGEVLRFDERDPYPTQRRVAED